MASVYDPEKTFTADQIFSAQRIIRMHSYSDLTAEEDIIRGRYIITAQFREEQTRRTTLTVDRETGEILRGKCTCYHVRYLGQCEHLCVLALLCRDEIMTGKLVPQRIIPQKSDTGISHFLSYMRGNADDGHASVSLYPVIAENDGSLNVSFRIGNRSDRTYIIKNISSFLTALRENTVRSYGSHLSFSHCPSAFLPESRRMVRFLLSLSGAPDAPVMQRSAAFSGRLLDDFIDCAEELQCFCTGRDKNSLKPLHFEHGLPEILTSLKAVGEGCVMTVSAPQLCRGIRSVCALDEESGTLRCASLNSENTRAAAELISSCSSGPLYISGEDLPSFSRHIYPLLASCCTLTVSGFDPFEYLPEHPSFEIYLNLSEGRISASLTAVYPSGRFDVLADSPSGTRRDAEAEAQMADELRRWFPDNDAGSGVCSLAESDGENLPRLLQEGLSVLQEKAAVYIPDALRKIRIMPQPHFRIGVSVTGSVLEMELGAGSLKPEEAADILSRYDPKKKYIRLKSGAFLEVTDRNAMDLLHRLQENMLLKNRDLSAGKASIPKYRALYLDALESSGALQIEGDSGYRELIRNIREKEADEYPLPESLVPVMREYQKEGVRWLGSLYENGFGALLADEMGLGKTLQVLSFLKVHPEFENILVVCPASLVFNWYAEVRKFTPEMEACMVAGSAEERQSLLNECGKPRILITSYDLLKRDLELYRQMHFSCEIIDEAQYIKNAATLAAQAVKAIDSSFRIALTGTPIENRLSELWSIFDYIMPGYFGSYARFRRMFELPVVRDGDDLAKEDLQCMIRPFVLRRLKKDVLKDLPDKIEEVYYATPDTEQRRLYDARVANLRSNLARSSEKEFSAEKMLVLMELTRLRQICCDPSLLYGNYTGNSAKTALCISLVQRAVEAGHKVLLFSQFTSMLEILCRRLYACGIAYHLLTGATGRAERAKMVSSFQNDDVPVFCISLKAGGTGLNLTAADIVIHFDPWWNTAVENQASDRAHRIGQKNIVTVYRLILKDTIEERILQMQAEKAGLADRMLGHESMSPASFSREELLKLL